MKSRISASTWAEIRTAFASGIGLRELARNMGIPAGTVLARAKREGWTRQLQSAKALGSPAIPPPLSPADAAAVTMAERGQRHVNRVAGIVERTLPALEQMSPIGILDRVEDLDRLDRVARRSYGLKDGEAPLSNVLVNIDLRSLNLAQADIQPTSLQSIAIG